MPETEEEPKVRPFNDWLNDQRRGSTHEDLSKALNDVVAGVVEHGKAGELALKIKVKPGGDGTVSVTDELVVKVPEPNRAASMYFVDDEANLHREDPRQTKLDLREVTAKNVRDIGS